MLRFVVFLALSVCSLPVIAADTASPKLLFPLGCNLGTDCWVARYSYRAGEKKDYRCGHRTQVGHRGTDFVLNHMEVMEKGVPVLAVADGVILRKRDGEPDISSKIRGRDAIRNRECGNTVIIQHSGGWQTGYCHLKNGSITHEIGATVKAGEVVGQVGLSGMTEYPHLHFNLLKNGQRIDPFDGSPIDQQCEADKSSSLWAEPIPYEQTSFINVSLKGSPPDAESLWHKSAKTLPKEAAALVLTGTLFGLEAGDEWHFKITQPDGKAFFQNVKKFPKDKHYHYHFGGKKRPPSGFMKGNWRGDITIVRDGEKIITKSTNIVVE